MLDTAPGIKFYLSMDEIVARDELLQRYMKYKPNEDRREISQYVLDRGVNVQQELFHNESVYNDVEDCKQAQLHIIDQALDLVYWKLWDDAFKELKAFENLIDKKHHKQQTYRKVSPSNDMRGYAKSIHYTIHERPSQEAVLGDVLFMNRCWTLTKPHIIPPDRFEPKYTWGLK